MVYKFEWNYRGIKNQKSFEQLIKNLRNNETGFNYEQAARLFYEGKDMVVMIELQIPTKDMIYLSEREYIPWLDAYEVKNLEDYDTSNEIYTGIGNGVIITFDNAKELMFKLAKELCEED